MYGGGLGHEFQHGLVVQGFYFVEGPVGAEHQEGGLRVAESKKAVYQGHEGTWAHRKIRRKVSCGKDLPVEVA
jgi:hypothetical protein